MRLKLFLFVLLALLVAPVPAHAQTPITFSSVYIRLWPEYDDPAMLVMYDFELPRDVDLPINFTIALPPEALLHAIAYYQDGLKYVPESDVIINQSEITIRLTQRAIYHLEYYLPLATEGTRRTFTYTWSGQYATEQLLLELIPPLNIYNFSAPDFVVPRGKHTETNQDIFHTLTLTNLPVGETRQFPIAYDRDTDELVGSKPNLPSIPTDSSTGNVTFSTYTPLILGVLGVLLIGGGIVAFILNNQSKPSPARHRHAPAAEKDSKVVYCSECGKRATSADRFCRSCGTSLRRA
jgi:hypothetical protein